jgi:hypothetical protein
MKIVDGYVIGYVKTDIHCSECEFEICKLDFWKTLNEEEREELIKDTLYDSGMMEFGVKYED